MPAAIAPQASQQGRQEGLGQGVPSSATSAGHAWQISFVASDFCINLAEVIQQQHQQQQPQPQQDQVKLIEDRKFIESVKHLYKLHKERE